MPVTDHGEQKDILAILKDHGFNWIRLRLFCNPRSPKGYSDKGYCDLDHTLTMAKRIKAAGMGLLLDFHYSDTWADPAVKIMIHLAWGGQNAQSRSFLDKAIAQGVEFGHRRVPDNGRGLRPEGTLTTLKHHSPRSAQC